MEELLKWFNLEIEIAESAGPFGYAALITLKQGKKRLIKIIEEVYNESNIKSQS